MFSLGDNSKVYPATDILLKKLDLGNDVVIIGGGLVGCELAVWLAREGKNVTIVEVLNKLLAVNGPLCHANSEMLEKLVPFSGVNVLTSSKVLKTIDNGVMVEVNGEKREIHADSIVLAIGYSSESSLYNELEYEFSDIHVIGDARRVANIMYAIWDAFEVANSI